MLWKITPLKSPDLIKHLLLVRGIKTSKEEEQFFHPSISYYDKDLKIPGISKAHKRIIEAIKNNELIIIYGDYDVDGI
ncbi:MAG: single-stranded-DNA-specific exonuclease RecJ, partial [Candidatus Daviesbacteria bacterium]|nr:single-stranded-DNA-specific exonuclease RecJ [Candidatus Daviesbacteria bacterium]